MGFYPDSPGCFGCRLGELWPLIVGGGAGLVASFRRVRFLPRARGRVWRACVLSQSN
nr:MAG TPA: hypothetical protein [Caudoviricetes sp.]